MPGRAKERRIQKNGNIFRVLLTLMLSGILLTVFSGVGLAVSNDEIMQELLKLKQRVQVVESKLSITEDKLNVTENRLSETKTELVNTKKELVKAQHAQIDAQTSAKKPDHIKFSKITGTPKIVSRDGRSSLAIGGRVFLDVASLPGQYSKGGEDKYQSSGTESEFRKIYFDVGGTFWRDWEYDLSLNFAENEVDLKKAILTYGGWKKNKFSFGFQKPAFGLENTQSSKYSQFMERSLTDTFSPDRDLGFSWRHTEEWGAIKVGVFVPNSIDGNDDGDNYLEDYTYIGRLTVAPIESSNQLLHLGLSAAYSDYDGQNYVDFDTRPESHLSKKIVSTKEIVDPEHTFRYGAEAAYSTHGFLFEGEYVNVDTKGYYDGAEDDDTYRYNAWYISASYMLTGEAHPYNKKKGTFRSVLPDHPLSKGGLGAWELALRYSSIDLNDNGENGGEMDDITFGLNWYLENNIRLMVNYIHYDADSYKDSSKYIEDQDDNIFQTRLQWFF